MAEESYIVNTVLLEGMVGHLEMGGGQARFAKASVVGRGEGSNRSSKLGSYVLDICPAPCTLVYHYIHRDK
jgi:hypothetical protein